MAAHAAAMLDHDVVIASKKRKSEMFGAQYLHAPIPVMTKGDPVEVDYILEGTPDQYREKVYGKTSRVEVSPESLSANHLAWDIRQTYDSLWRTYGSFVQNIDLSPRGEVDDMLKHLNADRVISSIPAPFLCKNDNHSFYSEEVWSIGDAPERGVFCPVQVKDNTIICDGTGDVAWYRASNVFGYHTAEWPHRRKPPVESVALVTKPLRTDCDCYPNIMRVGRYGRWQKGVLSHEAFEDVTKMLRISAHLHGWQQGRFF